ncbi:polyprenyl synthetase family protein [uncultured Bacteroides sp.]|jgi:octaprenyl-diphosphate synthase|uniref:polyprenyl synthetase family protein n=1 Tax=uncultured Bacteroides sp. TaxID=162156 RepID=UPI0025F77000|nr:polyprenyl synthetase family protein [uncultured Bacteroides sp.]
MDSISFIKAPITTELAGFRQLFDSSLSSSNTLLDSVVSHIRQRQGKMMRPMLVMLVARLYGEVRPATLHAAASLELLHTASLVHDDVVDESSERRGQLSANAAFNNKVAVLAGDYLLATSLVHAQLTESHPIIRLVSRLGQDLADGELLQLSNVSNLHFSEPVYFDVIRKKTAALFAACTQAAALSMEVGEEDVEKARLLGEYIGICFQIRDDIFDYFDSEEVGKPTGNDMREGKLTLPALHVLNTTASDEIKAIAFRVKEGNATSDEIARFIDYIKAHGGIEYAEQTMNDYKQKAFDLLDSLPASEITASLRAYLDYVVDRKK